METKTFHALHFEDDKSAQKFIRKIIEDEIGGETLTETTLLNAKSQLNNKFMLEAIDCIIVDFMFPNRDATSILHELAKSKKPVLFYTCLDEDDFCEKCLKVLKSIPYNFQYVQKASIDMAGKIRNFIRTSA